MTRKSIAIHVGGLQDMGRRFVEAWHKLEKGGRLNAPENVTFTDLDSLLRVMSAKRLEVLRHLRRAGPQSVRRLAGELRRDYKNVHSDVQALIRAGLIIKTRAHE
ncbi:MAG: hypothetical protein ACREB3_16130, partial [Burkholderiales bacterium]